MDAGRFRRTAIMYGLSPTIILTAVAPTTTIAATGDRALPVEIKLLHVRGSRFVKVVNETRHPSGRRGCAGAVGSAARTVLGPGYELKAVLPHETSPAQYRQVDQRELQTLADEGWELVTVVPYVYKNEEHGTPDLAPRPMVTQVYPGYFFRRPKLPR